MILLVQMLAISGYIYSTNSELAFFVSSYWIRSVPGALLFLSFCVAFCTLSNVGVMGFWVLIWVRIWIVILWVMTKGKLQIGCKHLGAC